MTDNNLVNYTEFCHVVTLAGAFILGLSYVMYCASYFGSGISNIFLLRTGIFGLVFILEGVIASFFKERKCMIKEMVYYIMAVVIGLCLYLGIYYIVENPIYSLVFLSADVILSLVGIYITQEKKKVI